MPKGFLLRRLKINEISLVDRPANLGARAVLMKMRQEDNPMSDKGAGQKTVEDLTKENEFLKSESEKLSKKFEALDAKHQELAKTAEAQAKELEKAREALADATEKLKKGANDGGDPEDVLKGLSPEARKLVEKAQADAEAAQKRIEKMEQEQLEKAYISKAEALKSLPQKAEDFGPLLKRVATGTLAEGDMDALLDVLKAANTAIEEGLLKAAGRDVTDEPSATSTIEAKIDKLAKERAQKDGIPYAVAYTKVLEEDPKLYAEHRAQTN